MARTIGAKNVNLVKKVTRSEIEKIAGKPYFVRSIEESNIEDTVIEKLPAELWDIWEMADQEIRRIIIDVIFDSRQGD